MSPHDAPGYVVYFFDQALEALGEPIKPYLQEGQCVLCREVDTAGALLEMTLDARTTDGTPVKVELMVPTQMVRMIVSAHGDEKFGFHPRVPVMPATALPVAGPTAQPAQAPSQAVPSTPAAPAEAPLTQTPPKP